MAEGRYARTIGNIALQYPGNSYVRDQTNSRIELDRVFSILRGVRQGRPLGKYSPSREAGLDEKRHFLSSAGRAAAAIAHPFLFRCRAGAIPSGFFAPVALLLQPPFPR
jgi:hypothetical protein